MEKEQVMASFQIDSRKTMSYLLLLKALVIILFFVLEKSPIIMSRFQRLIKVNFFLFN